MSQHGRRAERVTNPSVEAVLKDGESQYVTTNGHCDCGTVLGSVREGRDTAEADFAKEVSRLKRKGWSDTKISRALGDRERANERSGDKGPDSFELWNAILTDFRDALNLPYVGLMVRMYSGNVESEVFEFTRHRVAKNIPMEKALGFIRPDEVTIFQIR